MNNVENGEWGYVEGYTGDVEIILAKEVSGERH